MKKALLKDLDGTFLGSIGAVIPQSEYEWDGDPRRGLGDYRIPKEMVTTLTGTRILYDSLAPNKGNIFYYFMLSGRLLRNISEILRYFMVTTVKIPIFIFLLFS